MKKVEAVKEQVKSPEEEKKFKQRVYYFEKVKGLPHKEAVERAAKLLDTIAGVLSPWGQRQLAKKKGQPQPLKLPQCPKCGLIFLVKEHVSDDEARSIGLDTCPGEGCGIRYYFCE